MTSDISEADLDLLAWQLGRQPRAVVGIAHRCPCGAPDVVQTHPRLPDGTPFPTLYYLTCPRLAGAIGGLEGSGLMREMEARLTEDGQLAAKVRLAHDTYLKERSHREVVPEIEGISAGGMPSRVKCLHVLAAHALASGPGVNPLGDEVLDVLDPWWQLGGCSMAAQGRTADE